MIISGINSDIPSDILSDMVFDLYKGPCIKNVIAKTVFMLCFETSQKLFFGLSKTLFRETFASRYDESWLYMFVAIFSRKFGEGQAEERAKLNVYFQGGGPGNLTNPIKCLPAKQEVAPGTETCYVTGMFIRLSLLSRTNLWSFGK